MKHRRWAACLLAGLALWMSAAPAEARRGDRYDRGDEAREQRQDDTRRPRQQEGISLDEAVARVRRETGGRVLSAEARGGGGATVYRIKVLLPNGAVRVVHVDAQR